MELDKVWRRSAKMFKEVEQLCYKERLKGPALFSLERRGLRREVIKVYKTKTVDEVNWRLAVW